MQSADRNRYSSMSNAREDHEPKTGKLNLDEPQEEFIADVPPSAGEGSEVPPPQPNPEKDPDEWTTGNEPMTGPQMSYLKTLCQEAGTEFDGNLNKADASKMIDFLQKKTGRGQ